MDCAAGNIPKRRKSELELCCRKNDLEIIVERESKKGERASNYVHTVRKYA